MDEKSQNYLDAYLAILDEHSRQKHTAFSSGYFCADEHNANICAELIFNGDKTATCSMEYWYSHKNEPMPRIGDLQVVTNWSGEPVCIIETTSVETCKYNEVTEEFAYAEGEGDKSLKWWQAEHWDFFASECREIGIEPQEDMRLVLERFRIVHRLKGRGNMANLLKQNTALHAILLKNGQ